MRIVCVNVGRARIVVHDGRQISTGIFKSAVAGPVAVRQHQVEGDEQADRSVHGGPEKAVYAYPSEHYEYWRRELERSDLSWGSFGENLTTAGLFEPIVCVGDRVRMGTVELEVAGPRLPCQKLAIRLGRPDILKRFAESLRSGIYFRVVGEGSLQAGDEIFVVRQDAHRLSVEDVARVYMKRDAKPELVRRAISCPSLSESWRDKIRERYADPSLMSDRVGN